MPDTLVEITERPRHRQERRPGRTDRRQVTGGRRFGERIGAATDPIYDETDARIAAIKAETRRHLESAGLSSEDSPHHDRDEADEQEQRGGLRRWIKNKREERRDARLDREDALTIGQLVKQEEKITHRIKILLKTAAGVFLTAAPFELALSVLKDQAISYFLPPLTAPLTGAIPAIFSLLAASPPLILGVIGIGVIASLYARQRVKNRIDNKAESGYELPQATRSDSSKPLTKRGELARRARVETRGIYATADRDIAYIRAETDEQLRRAGLVESEPDPDRQDAGGTGIRRKAVEVARSIDSAARYQFEREKTLFQLYRSEERQDRRIKMLKKTARVLALGALPWAAATFPMGYSLGAGAITAAIGGATAFLMVAPVAILGVTLTAIIMTSMERRRIRDKINDTELQTFGT